VGEGPRLVIPPLVWDLISLLLGLVTVYAWLTAPTMQSIEDLTTRVDVGFQKSVGEDLRAIRTVAERIERVLLDRLPPR
jgi:hypothetical protein